MKFTYTGMLIVLLGAMMGDSENLIFPAVFITIGAILLHIGYRRGEQEDD